MIEKLTPEQEAKFPEYVDKWLGIGLNTDECNFADSVLAIRDAYKTVDIDPPQFFIGPVNSPIEGAMCVDICKKLVADKTEFEDPAALNVLVMERLQEEIKKFDGNIKHLTIADQAFGFAEYWLPFYDYFQTECGLDLERINPFIEIAKNCGWWTPLKNIAILQHRPLHIKRDDQTRAHCETDAAIKYRSDWNDPSNVYVVHGVRVTKKIIERDYDVKDIEDEENAEVRRVMIELYGADKFLKDSNAELVHSCEIAKLYKKVLKDDPEPLMMVEVINSTAETNGDFKTYWIRVDPNAYGGLETVGERFFSEIDGRRVEASPSQAAVASTWREPDGSMIYPNDPRDYCPSIET
jgi:hypothetical protein